eukprot:jgi/Phyca11/536743/estExt2_fgenesh1_pg.C_PHYCAscaffold_610051
MKRTLLLSALLLARVQGSEDDGEQPTDIAKLKRDEHLEMPLQELLLAPLDGEWAVDLDARLQRAFVQCRELGVTSLLYETISDSSASVWMQLDADDVAYCNRLRYVRHQRRHVRNVQETLAIQQDSYSGQVEDRAADDVSFQEFFELYAENSKPVLLHLNEEEKDPVAQLLGLESSNDADEDAAKSRMDEFLSVCFGDEAKTRRSDSQIKRRPMRVEHKDCAAILESTFRVPVYMAHDYVQRTNASRSEAFVPAIVELPSVTDSSPPNVKEIVACPYGLHMLAIPLEKTAISMFDRKFEPTNPHVDLLREIALGADASVATGSTVLDTEYFQRVPELYTSVELEPGRDMLFVPGNIISTMRSLTTSSAKLLRFCYCDAANVKDVKQTAGLNALLMTRDNKDEGLYALFWSTFVKWPREPAYLTKKNRRHKDDQEGEDEQLSRRERLKQWQDDKRWERYIEVAGTLPASEHDLTRHGYEVSWKREDPENSAAEAKDEMENAVNVTHDQLKRSKASSTLFGDDFDGRDLEAVITGLRAETAYSFSKSSLKKERAEISALVEVQTMVRSFASTRKSSH